VAAKRQIERKFFAYILTIFKYDHNTRLLQFRRKVQF
jgi:hypothetical protein